MSAESEFAAKANLTSTYHHHSSIDDSDLLAHYQAATVKETAVDYAKWIVAAIAVFNFGGYVTDAVIPFTAKQHLYNPHWPPHAKFHNCQGMLTAIGLGLLSLFVLFGLRPLTLPTFYLQQLLHGYISLAPLRANLPGHNLGRSRVCTGNATAVRGTSAEASSLYCLCSPYHRLHSRLHKLVRHRQT